MIRELFYLLGIVAVLAASGCVGGDDKGNDLAVKTTNANGAQKNLTEDDILMRIKGGYSSNSVELSGGDVVIYHEVMGDGWKQALNEYDVYEIFKELFKTEDPRISSVKVVVPLHGTDKYGQEQTTIATSYTMTNKTASRINWDKFSSSNLRDVVDDFYLNPNLHD